MNLANFLEKWTQDGDGGISQWLFIDGNTTNTDDMGTQNKEAIKGKDNYGNTVTAATKSQHFEPFGQSSGKLGSHLIRKMGTTEARKQGVSNVSQSL